MKLRIESRRLNGEQLPVMVLADEHGEILPGQSGHSFNQGIGGEQTLTVTFKVDGDGVSLAPSQPGGPVPGKADG